MPALVDRDLKCRKYHSILILSFYWLRNWSQNQEICFVTKGEEEENAHATVSYSEQKLSSRPSRNLQAEM